jgi:hypothetical protein
VAQLQLVARSSEHVGGPPGYVLLSPYPGLRSAVVASAWGAQIALSGPNDPRLSEFLARYQGGNQGGEKGGGVHRRDWDACCLTWMLAPDSAARDCQGAQK